MVSVGERWVESVFPTFSLGFSWIRNRSAILFLIKGNKGFPNGIKWQHVGNILGITLKNHTHDSYGQLHYMGALGLTRERLCRGLTKHDLYSIYMVKNKINRYTIILSLVFILYSNHYQILIILNSSIDCLYSFNQYFLNIFVFFTRYVFYHFFRICFSD